MPARLRTVIIVLATLAAVSSAVSNPGDDADRPARVSSHGALREVMHEGKVGPIVDLATLLPNDNLYAIGALSGLRGEITILGGTGYVAYPKDADGVRLEVIKESDEAACLLVTAEVRDWVSVTTQSEIPFEQLDKRIVVLAQGAGVDVSESFPFVVEGRVRELRWHIIDGSRLSGGESSHEEHSNAAVKQYASKGDAMLLGFYSDRHHGIFTHMGSNTHVHCIVDKPRSSGHVEHVVLPAGVTIKFPKASERSDSAGDR